MTSCAVLLYWTILFGCRKCCRKRIRCYSKQHEKLCMGHNTTQPALEDAYEWREDNLRHLLERTVFKDKSLRRNQKINHLQWIVKNRAGEFHRSARSHMSVMNGINADFRKNKDLIVQALESLVRRLWWLKNLDLPVSREKKLEEIHYGWLA